MEKANILISDCDVLLHNMICYEYSFSWGLFFLGVLWKYQFCEFQSYFL